MGQKRMFACRLDEVPAVGYFLADCIRRDLLDFQIVNDIFTEDFVVAMETKSSYCNELISSDILTQEIESITKAIKAKRMELRNGLNKVKLFIDEANGSMSASADGMGVETLRTRIYKGSSESVVTAGKAFMINVKRNLPVLQGKGLKQTLLDEFSANLDYIDTNGKIQNQKITERNRNTEANHGDFNELWATITRVLETGHAIYLGVDDVKLKDYTLSVILQRISSRGNQKDAKAEAKVAATVEQPK